MKLFIGCSSRNEIPQKYFDDCKNYLEEIFKEENDLIFGASINGLMGLSYELAKKHNRETIGICPVAYKDDLLDLNCTTEILTNTISERTDKAIELSDAIIILPGGIGTIYELLTAIECKRSREFDKPIIIYNSNNFYDKMIDFLEKIYIEQFGTLNIKDCYYITKSAEDTINYLNEFKAVKKSRCKK